MLHLSLCLTLSLSPASAAKPMPRTAPAGKLDACHEAAHRVIPRALAEEMENGNNIMSDATFCRRESAGCSLEELLPGGVIARLGLRGGDVLLRTEKGGILNTMEALNALNEIGRGKSACLRFLRGGRERSIGYSLGD